MALTGYASIPANATLPGAPIDAFLLRTLRQNDDFFESKIRALFASPFLPMGGLFPTGLNQNIVITGPITDTHRVFNYNVKKIELQAALDTKPGVPLIWCATEEIVLKANINATGKGALKDQKGDFGGSGGARTGVNGIKCELPLVTPTIDLAGASTGPSGVGTAALEMWVSRLFSFLHVAKGGGPGARQNAPDAGGEGGGIVVLCAPKIKLDGAVIEAKGTPGIAGADTHGNGGGGGGVVILIAHEFDNVVLGTNVHVDGGAGSAPVGKTAGGNGGNGLALKIQIS
jgi:hypothetical protein